MTCPTLNVCQINVGRCRASHDLLYNYANVKKANILLVSEPNEAATRTWYRDQRADAAIKILGNEVFANEDGNGEGFVWVRVGTSVIVSCYASPNKPIEDLDSILSDVEAMVRARGWTQNLIVGGDFNAKSPEWGAPLEDPRGNLLASWAAGLGLVVCNHGSAATFQRNDSMSHIDVTLASPRLWARMTKWEVNSKEELLTFHNLITFTLEGGHGSRRQGTAWNWKNADPRRLEEAVGAFCEADPASAEELSDALERACRHACPEKVRGRPRVYWWSAEVAEMRKRANAARRAYQRTRPRGTTDAIERARDLYKTAKKQLRKQIDANQKQRWKELLQEIDRDPWGQGYQIFCKRLRARAPPVTLEEERMDEVVQVLFPPHPRIHWLQEEPSPAGADFSPFTDEEVVAAGQRLREKKAPGPDGIPAEIVRRLTREKPGSFRRVYNSLVEDGTFPAKWKKATLVLIRKGNKPLTEPSSMRPLCLLDTVGKLFEHLLLGRMEDELDRLGGLSGMQFGFRKGKCTEDALSVVNAKVEEVRGGPWKHRQITTLVLLDIKNAFNSAPWKGIVAAMRRRGFGGKLIAMAKSYLSERTIVARTEGRLKTYGVTSGVPQGSILGPFLWNLLYDGVLRLKYPEGVTAIAFADDLAIVASSREPAELEEKVDGSLEQIRSWLSDTGLELAEAKTEAVLLTGQRRAAGIHFRLGHTDITPVKTVTYLGVKIDEGLRFHTHVDHVARRAGETISSMSRLMPNVGGPRASKRKLYANVANSVMLYAAPIWRRAMSAERSRATLLKVQRRAALRVCSGYRTVSLQAALVVASCPPIDLLVERESEKRTMERWQERWREEGEKGKWTKRLIPDLSTWVNRSHGEVDYYLTQFLTGHGNFRTYLHKIRKIPDATCLLCGDQEETAEHLFFNCEGRRSARLLMEEEVGAELTPDNIISVMLQKEENWVSIGSFIRRQLREEGTH